ncbi:deleted in lung and esophageal cancer protein 1 isoform X2 [Nematostella vectensis]|uniref:deleted in lung and esophageal cancer protein 1 isoform X2 n=1 Tax=Nematostella vectensis TaxID=45351 RepID=UPI002076E10E|nr:deleted in lung and esophageal cancer protein 1 isoform X2 [Nematostella vectensis]
MKMADANGKEVEPPMHIQRPSSARSQDVSHILASVFRELFTRDSVGEQRVKHLATSRSGEETYHDKYVQQLRKIQQDRDQCHREADMLETHIMQAQAAAMAADERDIQKALVECEDYQKLGLPPGKSNLRHCLDTELLRKFGLIVPQDFTSEDPKPARPPQAADIPSYARCTTSSQQRFRKTPPLTDYVTTSSLAYPFAASKQTSLAHEQGLRESPPPQTAKTKQSKTSAWKDSMKPNQRKVERDDLQRLESKAEYKQNPRFVPPEAAELIQKKTKHRSKTKTTSQDKSGFKAVEVFLVSPNPLVFTDYNVGEVYELSIELKNVTSSSRQVRVVPPTSKHFSIGLGRFPGENGVVAPGMSCVYPIRFAPDSLADYDDLIKIKSQVDPPLIVHLQARRPPPSLSLPPTLRCGHCLVGGYKAVRMYCTNSGGDGRFCLIPKTQWPTASFKWTLEDPGSVNVNPFEIEPAMFQLRKGESTTIKITFSPYAATFFKQEIAMVCDNCQVKSFSVEGTGQMAGIQFMSISGGLSQYDVGEMKDVSSKFLVRFDHQNPQTNHSKILEIKNTTNVSLPFRWKLFKPFLPSVSQEPTGRVHRVPDDQGVFSVTPNMGALPPHEVVHFSLENAPKEVGSFHGVAHMVLEEIPVQGGDAAGSIAKDVTAIEIEVKAECKPFYIEVSPALLVIPGRMMLGTPYLYSVKIQNNSVSRSSFEWQDIKTDDYAVSIEPRSGVLGAGEMVELCVSVFGNSPDSMDATLTCYVPFSSSPVFLRVKGNFQGPEVLIGLPDLNFGLVRLGKSSKSTIPIKNTSIVRADWSMEECSDMTQDVSEFTFVPSHGSLGPMEEITCEVTFAPTQCRRVRSVFQCAVRKGKTSYLSVFSEVQTPLVCLVSSSLYIEDVYLNVPVSREVVLQNHTLLATHFQWKEIVDDKGDKGYTVTFEPSSGELGPRQALPVQMTFTGHRKGPLESLVTSCEVTGMDKPIWLDISTDVRGLNVTFETPKLLDLRRPDEIKTVDIESTPLLLEFETVPLGEQGKATLVMTNTSAIRARYSLHVEHFKAAKPPSPPEGQPKNKNSRRLQGLLARTPNIADPLSKTATKAQADHSATVLRDGRGAAFILSPCEGELLPFGYQVVEVSAYNDMWGDYRDLLVCQVEGLDPVYIPIKMTVVGCPLNFQMMKDQAPILRFGTHVSGAPSVQRSLRLNNTSPFDIRLDWGTYNIIRDDPQLLDMLVFYGQPLPLFDSKGQEQIPSPPPLPDSLCDELPLIQVKLQEHDGILSSKPFGVTPSQQIIPAKSHATMNVTFTPHTDDPEGEACICYAAAYMSLDGQNVNIPGRVSRKQGLEMARFRLDVTANIRPALLSVEMEEDKGAHFTTAASDVV